MPRGYDGTSASPDFANGAVTGAFSYAAGASYANDNSDSNSPYAGSNTANCSGCYQVAQVEEEPEGRIEETPEERGLEEWRQGIDNSPPRNPNADYPGPTPQQQRDFDALIENMESIGGGAPKYTPTPKGATQFIFPNGAKLRFDIAPGQYSPNQGPHINLQDVPGASNPNYHIPVKPNG